MGIIEEALKELFDKWKVKQREEPQENVEKTSKQPDYQDKFAPDGLLGDETQWINAKIKVLHMLKEPNWEKDFEYKDNYFWFRDVVNGTGEHDGYLLEKLGKEQYFLETGKYENIAVDCMRLKNAAFMNLSKRGGGNIRTNEDDIRLTEYVNYYQEEIIDEIGTFKPDVIICYDTYRWVKKLLPILMPKKNCVYSEKPIRRKYNKNILVVKLKWMD